MGFFPLLPWQGKRLLDGPASLEPALKDVRAHSNFSCPLSNRKGFSFMRQETVGSGVVVLRFSISPAAIFWAVIAIVVDAIKRHFGRTITHIGKKIPKIKPTITDLYSASAVSRVLSNSFIKASALHLGPRLISSGFPISCGVSVLDPVFVSEASARFVYPSSESWCTNDNAVSAVADAIPKRTPRGLLVGKVDDFEPLKSLARQVNKCCHGFTSIMVSNHLKARNSGVIDVPFSVAKPSYASGV